MRLALALLLLAGCNQLVGFDDDKLRVIDASTGPIDAPVDAEGADAMIDAAPGVCDPIAQTGCGTGEKCTWIVTDSAASPQAGVVGCVTDGAVARGGTCNRGPDGATSGFDDCMAGDYCAHASASQSGLCEAICTQAPDSCGGGQRCSTYFGLFGDPSPVGLCDFTCDPVTQVRTFDGAARCGSVAAVNPEYGCYKIDHTPGVCTRVAAAAFGLTQDDNAYNWPGPVFLNGCAAGFAPIMRSAVGASNPPICMAYCRPTETSTSSTAGEGGLVGSGYTCADRGAAGHACRFLWFVEGVNATTADNGVGFCMTPANYIGDWDQDTGTADTPLPRCNTLPNTDTDSDGIPENLELACAPFQ